MIEIRMANNERAYENRFQNHVKGAYEAKKRKCKVKIKGYCVI